MKGNMWTGPQMEKAMMEFITLPSRLKCVVIVPDFFDRDLLALRNNVKKFGTD
jgi:hypothetical protein